MKGLRNTGIVGTILLGLGAIAYVTNPQEARYQKYAQAAIDNQFKDRVCERVSEELGVWLEGQCHILVNTTSPYLAEIVSRQTDRQDFLLFSIYKADLPLPEPLPSYHLETIGVFGNFYTYQAKKL